MATIAAAKPVSQSEKAYQTIKEMIMRGDIKQGEALSILLLSEQLEIGRTPISNACQRLEYDGLVRVIPKQGVWVNTLSISEAQEIYESRAAIEGFFMRKALDLYTDADLEALERSIEQQLAYGEAGDYYNYMMEDTRFHRYPMHKYTNNTMTEMYGRLIDRIFMFGMKNTANESRMHNAIGEHREIVACIARRDEDAVVKAVEQHIMSGYIQLTGINKL